VVRWRDEKRYPPVGRRNVFFAVRQYLPCGVNITNDSVIGRGQNAAKALQCGGVIVPTVVPYRVWPNDQNKNQ